MTEYYSIQRSVTTTAEIISCSTGILTNYFVVAVFVEYIAVIGS